MTPPARCPSNALLALARVTGMVLLGAATALVIVLGKLTARSPEVLDARAARAMAFWCRRVCRIAGFRITVSGAPCNGAALVTPNHYGYADILVFSALVRGFILAKGEIMSWPVVGPLVRLSRHPVVERKRSASLATSTQDVEGVLRRGHSVCAWLEGTSTAGDRVLPFRSSLIQAAIDAGVPVQPAAIVWSADDPRIDVGEDVAYWREEHAFGPHLWRLFGLSGIRADVRFEEPIPTDGAERKGLAAEARRRVLTLLGMSETPDSPANL
ncbi:1-acyl-sn-glycerol-3-phosphate acyltransferase [Candidatus Poribacteria bacterium]|nr:1-acyl-sn-glycerol-3-phosphate acyltransferase [Candidatus Poribacteria bacterium]